MSHVLQPAFVAAIALLDLFSLHSVDELVKNFPVFPEHQVMYPHSEQEDRRDDDRRDDDEQIDERHGEQDQFDHESEYEFVDHRFLASIMASAQTYRTIASALQKFL